MNFFGRSSIFFIAGMLFKVMQRKGTDGGKMPVKRRRPLWQTVFRLGKRQIL